VYIVLLSVSQEEEAEISEVPADKVAFIALASIRGSTEYYDLRMLRRKHTALFSHCEPLSAAVVCAQLRRNSETVFRNERSSLQGSAGSAALSPLPLSLLAQGGGVTVDMLQRQTQFQYPLGAADRALYPAPGSSSAAVAGPGDAKYFKAILSNDATIANLQRSLNHLEHCRADLTRCGVDVECLRKLLGAQLQLARATRLVLK
jgi:hypothetical protein